MLYNESVLEKFMQAKKGNVKQKIKKSAKQLFFTMPYKDVSMRDVAAKSDMTVGNIYRYYENKEILFDDIVKKCHDEINLITKINNYAQSFTKTNVVINKKKVYKNSRFKTFILDMILKFITNNAEELYILINSSEGSKYENIHDKLIEIIKSTIMDTVEGTDEKRALTYAKMALSNISILLKDYVGDKKSLQAELKAFLGNFFEIFK